MKKIFYTILLLIIIFVSCNTNNREANTENWKQEILNTEKEFAEMAKTKGIPEAFLAYAAEEAVLMRNNTLIIGKEAMEKSFSSQNTGSGKVDLTWKPDFVDVSVSGDLGYTYGKYTYSVSDSLGNVALDSGIFHTVWKKQPDGSWRFVWD